MDGRHEGGHDGQGWGWGCSGLFRGAADTHGSITAGAHAIGALYPRLPMDQTRVNRVRFRAWRRGFREADLILGPFADSHAPSMTADELDELEVLLDQPDHDLYAWIIGTEPAPATFDGEMLARLRAFTPAPHGR